MKRRPRPRSLSRSATARMIAASSPAAMESSGPCPRLCRWTRSCTVAHPYGGIFCWVSAPPWKNALEVLVPTLFFASTSMIIDSPLTFYLFLATFACFSAGAVGALITARSPTLSRVVGHGCSLVGAIAAFAFGLSGLAGGGLVLNIPELLPIGGAAFGLDRVSAFFVVVIAVGAIPSALYAIDYTREYAGKYSLAGMAFAFNIFVAAMILIPLARNVLTFLLLWELMSLASYFLVITEHQREETLRAGWVYFVMTHAGFAALLVGFLLLARATGTMSFAEWGAAAAKLDATSRNLIFILFALGFGSKAGFIPLHVWLPLAHPAAPSHVSALMSGVMIKLGVYGMVRVGFEWL